MDCSLPDSCVHGILQARILEPIAMPCSRGASQPQIQPVSFTSLALAGGLPLGHLGSLGGFNSIPGQILAPNCVCQSSFFVE